MAEHYTPPLWLFSLSDNADDVDDNADWSEL
nr:MAG TPA: hypothetical protein [Caudoviricetes sp.]